MIRSEHQFDIRPDLRKAASTKAESTTAESVIRPKQLVRVPLHKVIGTVVCSTALVDIPESNLIGDIKIR